MNPTSEICLPYVNTNKTKSECHTIYDRAGSGNKTRSKDDNATREGEKYEKNPIGYGAFCRSYITKSLVQLYSTLKLSKKNCYILSVKFH